MEGRGRGDGEVNVNIIRSDYVCFERGPIVYVGWGSWCLGFGWHVDRRVLRIMLLTHHICIRW